MKKKAWPWNNAPEYDDGVKSGDENVTNQSQTRMPSLAYGEGVTDLNQSPSSTMVGLHNTAKDKKSKKKSAKLDFYQNDGILASFICDIANSMQDKVTGLQSYDNLSENAGLIFEYDNPQDVVYHMGTVKFPIDIIFIDNNDLVKKIHKNIQPGTLGTFGCADTKNVLEICGGLSDRLGISDGNKISISKDFEELPLDVIAANIGIQKKTIIKYSSYGQDKLYNWKNFPILNSNNKLVKKANKSTHITNLLQSFNIENKDIHVFDFDGLIQSAPTLRVYNTLECSDKLTPHVRLDGRTVAINKTASGDDDCVEKNIEDILNEDSNFSIIASPNKSFYKFLSGSTVSSDAEKMFLKLRKISYNKSGKPFIVTRLDNPTLVRDILMAKYSFYNGEHPVVDVIQIHKDSDANDIINLFRKKYGSKDIYIYSDEKILKRAGLAVSNDVKEKAKKIYKLLEDSVELATQSLDNMNHNLEQYNKISSTPEEIPKTKGLYHQSAKNNSELFKNLLIKVRDSIKLLNEIKDISTTIQLIDALTTNSQNCSDAIEEIFDLINQIESPEFVNILTQRVTAYSKLIEDLKSSMEKSKKYINADILGIIILSN